MMSLQLITSLAPTMVTVTVTTGEMPSSNEKPSSSSTPATQTDVAVSSTSTSAAPAATTSCGVSGDFTLDVGLRSTLFAPADCSSSTLYLSSLRQTMIPRHSLQSSIPTDTCSSPLAGHMFHPRPRLLCLRTEVTWQSTYLRHLRPTALSHNHPMQVTCRLALLELVLVLTTTHTGSMQRHCMSFVTMEQRTQL